MKDWKAGKALMVPAPWRRFSPLEARCGQEGGRGACGEEERCASPQGHQAGTQGSAVLSHWGTRLGPRGALFFPSTHPWGCQAETEGRVAALSRPEGLVPLHPSSGASQGCAQRTWDPKAGTRQKLRGSQHTGKESIIRSPFWEDRRLPQSELRTGGPAQGVQRHCPREPSSE